MSKIQGGKILVDYNSDIQAQLVPEIYVTVEDAGDNTWFRNTHDSKEDAVENGDVDGELVATYKLVRIEELRLVRSRVVVPTTIPMAP